MLVLLLLLLPLLLLLMMIWLSQGAVGAWLRGWKRCVGHSSEDVEQVVCNCANKPWTGHFWDGEAGVSVDPKQCEIGGLCVEDKDVFVVEAVAHPKDDMMQNC